MSDPTPRDGKKVDVQKAANRVILFRAPPGEDDPYEAALTASGLAPSSIKVLTERYELEELGEILRAGPGTWENIVISSKRGAEGWIRAAESLSERGLNADWSDLPLFSVGQSSIDALESSSLPIHLKPDISNSRVAKTASALLPLILSAAPRTERGHKSTLVLRGDKSLDEIPQGLGRAGRVFHEVVVYQTTEDADLASKLRDLENELRKDEVVWMAFFSPSSAGLVVPHLSGLRLDSPSQSTHFKIAAIGETTKRYMEELGIKVHAVAEEPTPAGIVQAISK